jgi:uncharacterized protein (DUF305 family)
MFIQQVVRSKLFALSGLILAGGIALSACSSDHDSMDMGMTPTSGNANAADVMFAQMMIPHHEQAVVMADLAPDRASDSQVLALASEIKQAQAPEIDLMQSWLQTWGVDQMPADEAMQDHGSHGMDGMLTEEQLSELAEVKGTAFDALFATYMIEHHEGAVAMAQDVLNSGQDPAVASLAREIIATQEKEILQLQALLNSENSNQSMAIMPSLGHMHGAVIDSGGLLVGTHDGVHHIEVASGVTRPIGPSRNDMMAFSGSPDELLVASGHPGLGSSLPNPLGLISSIDGGISWESISLSGQVDSHSLAIIGNEIVGWDTQGLVQFSSDGGRSWEPGPQITATSVAWFSNQIWLATVESGLQTWSKDSNTLTTVNAPSVLLAASPDGNALWRVDRDGSVHRTIDAKKWNRIGSVSRIEAFAADFDVAYALTGTSLEIIPV